MLFKFKNKLLLIFCIIILQSAYSFGNNISNSGKNKKIISLSPVLTEIIFHLEKGTQLSGRSSACSYPDEALKTPSVGNYASPSMEKVLEIKPDIIISSEPSATIRNTVEPFKIKFIHIPIESFQDYYKALIKIGKLLNCRTQAEKEIKRVKSIIEKYKKKNKNKKNRPLVYLEIWDKPYMTAGGKSYITELINYAGGKNIASDIDEGYFRSSEEWILSSKPDIIICPAIKTERKADIKNRKGWKRLPAVKNNRIYLDLNDDLIYRLGPRITEGIKLLNSIINDE